MAQKALTSGNTAFKLIMIAKPPGTTRGLKQKNVGVERLVQDNAKSCSVGFLRVVLAFGPQVPMKNEVLCPKNMFFVRLKVKEPWVPVGHCRAQIMTKVWLTLHDAVAFKRVACSGKTFQLHSSRRWSWSSSRAVKLSNKNKKPKESRPLPRIGLRVPIPSLE